MRFPCWQRHWPSLAPLLRRLGSRQIRNRGTIGGNVANASPIGDMPPALIVLDATLVLRSVAGERTIAAADFFRGYRRTALAEGEFLARIAISLPAPGEMFATYKVSKRMDQDISAVCGAFRLRLADGRVDDISWGLTTEFSLSGLNTGSASSTIGGSCRVRLVLRPVRNSATSGDPPR